MRYLFLVLLFVQLSHASCSFRVINYSLYPVRVMVGFYGGESGFLVVNSTSAKSITIKNENDCLSYDMDGSGVAYVDLTGGKKSLGGWRYDRQNGMIRAKGISVMGNDFVIGISQDGKRITLVNNYNPAPDVFQVQIKPSQFRDSKKSGSSN